MIKPNDKKGHLKPAIILSVAVGVAIIAIAVAAANVNRHVADTLTGLVAYSVEGQIHIYDCGEKSESVVEAAENMECFDGVFADEKQLYFIAHDEYMNGCIYSYNSELKSVTPLGMSGAYLAIDYDKNSQRVVFLRQQRENSYSIGYMEADGSETIIADIEDPVFSLSYSVEDSKIYYTTYFNDKYMLMSLNPDDGVSRKLLESTDEMGYVSSSAKYIYVTQSIDEKGTLMYVSKSRDTLNKMPFETESFNSIVITPVTDTKYIVCSDKSGLFQLYVCNGSNMVQLEVPHTDKDITLSDYYAVK